LSFHQGHFSVLVYACQGKDCQTSQKGPKGSPIFVLNKIHISHCEEIERQSYKISDEDEDDPEIIFEVYGSILFVKSFRFGD